jgi:hypothetical protein
MSKCEHCALSKADQKKFSTISEHKATKVGERLYMDISSVNTHTFGGNKYWLLVVDELSDMCWSYFLHAKSDLSNHMLSLITKLNNMQHVNAKYIRCDDAGENWTFQRKSVVALFNLTFEYTGPGSPQYNGIVERKFATLYVRVRSMLNAVQFTPDHRSGLWAGAAQTATDIENSLVSVNKPTPSYTLLYLQDPPSIKSMHAFGEIAVIENNSKRKIRNKLENRGHTGLYLGRAANHSTDVGRFLHLGTNRVILSRDITWLGKMYGEWKGLVPMNITC